MQNRGKFSVIILVFFCGVLISLALYHFARGLENQRIKAEFSRSANDDFQLIRDALDDHIDVLYVIRSLFASSQEVTRSEFREFTRLILRRRADIIALAWLPRVKAAERAAFEKAARDEGFADFEFKGLTRGHELIKDEPRQEYFPVYFEEPFEKNRIVFGLDMVSDPQRKNAMDRAGDLNLPISTGRIHLVREGTAFHFGTRVFLPVYQRPLANNTVEERRKRLLGFVSLLFNVGKTVSAAVERLEPLGIDVYVFDSDAPSEDRFLCFYPSRLRNVPVEPLTEEQVKNVKGLSWSADYNIAGRNWTFYFLPTPEYLRNNKRWSAVLVLIGMLSVTLLLSIYLSSILGRTRQIELTVQRRTRELEESQNKLKTALEEWESTFNSITDMIFIQSVDNTILKVNKALAEALKMPAEAIVGKRCFEVLHGTQAPWPSCPFEKTKSDHLAHTEEVFDQRIGLPLLVTTSPMFDSHGRLIGSVHVSKDISDRKRAEDELKKLSRLKTDFVSTVSHELRTPLAIMKEGISLVLDRVTGQISENQEKTLTMVYTNINRLSNLINDLLDISKIEAGRVELKKESVDICQLIRETVEKWKVYAGKKNQELALSSPECSLPVYLDQDKIIQVLNNLVSNAIKYTPEGGRIEISMVDKEQEIEVSVSDNGEGIAKEDLPRVFEKFQQFSRKAGAGPKGTGLGLAIARQLIEMHQGMIKVESTLGEGTKFTFIVPRADSEAVFKEHIKRGILHATENKLEFSLILVKLPVFRQIQHDLGPEKSERLISGLEAAVRSCLHKNTDTLLKDSGELAVLLPETSRNKALIVKSRIEEATNKYLAGLDEERLKGVSFSVGYATYPVDADSAEKLLEKSRSAIIQIKV